MMQHIRQVHLKAPGKGEKTTQTQSDTLRRWARKMDAEEIDLGALWCGFCACTLNSWQERVDHVAAHFQEGADIETWYTPYWYWQCPSELWKVWEPALSSAEADGRQQCMKVFFSAQTFQKHLQTVHEIDEEWLTAELLRNCYPTRRFSELCGMLD
jgi:hypothetical protein